MTDAGSIPAGGALKRIALTAAMTVVAINVWTGSPLFALWVGSRVQGTTTAPKMSSIAVVVVVLAALSFALMRLLALLGERHDALTGQNAQVRRHVPWLRSMRGEREVYPGEKPTVTMLERVLVIMVVTAFLAFEVWFFFFSASPIDRHSGRSALPDGPPVASIQAEDGR